MKVGGGLVNGIVRKIIKQSKLYKWKRNISGEEIEREVKEILKCFDYLSDYKNVILGILMRS